MTGAANLRLNAKHLEGVTQRKKLQDDVSIAIGQTIRRYCDWSSSEQPNLPIVFAAELLKYASNFFILKTEPKGYEQPVIFPYLNTAYISNTPEWNFQRRRSDYSPSRLNRILKWMAPFSTDIDCSPNLPISRKDILLGSRGKCLPLRTPAPCLYIKSQSQQMTLLKDLLGDLSKLIGEEQNKNFVLNFLSYVDSFLIAKKIPPAASICVLGSNVDIDCRIRATNYLSEGLPVVCLGHGHQSFCLFDEPVVGLGELSLCTHYLTYGRSGLFENASYSKPVGKAPQLEFFSSSIVQKLFTQNEVKPRAIGSKTKILYVPTGFSANQRYGPFRDFDDDVYAEWQRQLFQVGLNISYKTHPKNRSDRIPEGVPLVSGRLEDVFNDYDVIFLDFISTASSLAFASNKPIVYFDLGLRNLTAPALEACQKRAFWRRVQVEEDATSQVREIIREFNAKLLCQTNLFSDMYSLSKSGETEIFALIQVLDRIRGEIDRG